MIARVCTADTSWQWGRRRSVLLLIEPRGLTCWSAIAGKMEWECASVESEGMLPSPAVMAIQAKKKHVKKKVPPALKAKRDGRDHE